MDRWTDGQTENLPILQDFVPYRGRCPKRQQIQQKQGRQQQHQKPDFEQKWELLIGNIPTDLSLPKLMSKFYPFGYVDKQRCNFCRLPSKNRSGAAQIFVKTMTTKNYDVIMKFVQDEMHIWHNGTRLLICTDNKR